MSAEIHEFPRAGFIIGEAHCAKPGPEGHLMCLRADGHDGDHSWCDWRGSWVRMPNGRGIVRFGGFAQ